MKVGDRLTLDGKTVEVTYVMNEKCYGYKPISKAIKVEEPKEETEEAPKRRARRK